MALEHDFAAWLDRRDAAALARVFDATGGKLLLLAAHLAGEGAQAQDLVQATFVAAMARGSTWDRGRPLWPWLAAILHNEARMDARRSRRRREVVLDDATASPRAGGDPQRMAASEEVLAAVLAAIDALPLPYRQVLRLRLVHGLRPVDIARSLEVPVGTVRAQLHRGLEQLRSALPLGVAALIGALLMGDNALLAQTKERVLEHAGRGSGAAAAGTVIAAGWWTMHAKAIGVLFAGCALLALLGFGLGVPEAWWTTAVVATPAQPARTELPVAVGNAPEPRVEPDRRAAVAVEEEVWPLIVTVQPYDGAPIPGAAVTVWATMRNGVYWNRDANEFGRDDVAAGTTGADGVFRSSLDGMRERSALVNRTTYLWIEASWPHGEPQQVVVELPRTRGPQQVTATIKLRRSRAIMTGRVVDGAGVAVVRARVGTSRGASTHVGNDSASRADGTFFVEWDGDEDSWPDRLVVASPEHGTATIALPAWSAEPRPIDLGTIVLQAGATVQGRAVLGDGSGVAGIQLQVLAIDPSLGDDVVAVRRWLMNKVSYETISLALREGRALWRGAQTHTLADGSFRFTGLQPDGVYLLSLWALGASSDRVVRPGADPIELRIDKQLLAIDVFDEQGTPVPGAQVTLAGYDPSSTWLSYVKWPGFPETGLVCSRWWPSADPNGRRIVLAPFGWIFRVTVVDDFVQPIALRHDALPGVYRATCRVDVRTEARFGKLHIHAVDENGAPIQFGPDLKAVDRELQINDRRLITPPEGKTWDLPAGRWHVETVLGKEVTYLQDQGGYARGFQEHVVTIEDGKTTELKLTAPPAGLVAFEVTSNKAAITTWRKLRVEEAGRDVTVLPRDPDDPRPTREGAQITRFITKQAFAPGRHSFLLQADGYQAATCEVDVVADQLTHVRVEMFAR